MPGISSFFDGLGDLLLLYTSRRFRVHRIIERSDVSIVRSLVIESIGRRRFLELSHDETLPYERYPGVDPNKLSQIVDLTDILAALNRLRFDVILYGKLWTSQGGSSIHEAIERAAARRIPFEDRFHQAQETERQGLEPTLTEFEFDAPEEAFHQDCGGALGARSELSFDDTAASENEMIRRLSDNVSARGKKKAVYWETVTRSDERREHQVLVF